MRRAKPPRVTPEMIYSGCERFLAELSAMQRAQKITLGEMRSSGGPRRLLVYCGAGAVLCELTCILRPSSA